MLLLYVLCELSKMWKTCWNRCAKLPLLRLSRPSSRSPGSQTCEKDSRSKVLKKAWWRIKNTKKLEMTGLGNFNIRHRGVRVCQCQGIKWVRTRERINRYLDIGPKQTCWANSTFAPFYPSSLFYLEPNAPFCMTHEEQLLWSLFPEMASEIFCFVLEERRSDGRSSLVAFMRTSFFSNIQAQRVKFQIVSSR